MVQLENGLFCIAVSTARRCGSRSASRPLSNVSADVRGAVMMEPGYG